MIHHRLRSLRMSALVARASGVCISCSLAFAVFTGAGLAKPFLTFDDAAVSQEANAQPPTAQPVQAPTQSGPPQQQANPPQSQSQQRTPPQSPPQQTPPPQTKPNNPFENVPATPDAPKTPEKQGPTEIQE